MSEKKIDLRLVGIVRKPHGLKGEVILEIISDYPNSILSGTLLYAQNIDTGKYQEKPLEIEFIKIQEYTLKKTAVVKFKEINSRNDADKLINIYLYRNSDEFSLLEDDTYWIDDLKGCKVFSDDKKYIGIVVDVKKGLSNDNILVKKDLQSVEIKGIKEESFYIPLVDDYIKSIDVRNKKIILKLIPEFI